MVSFSVSPFDVEVDMASENPMTRPPRRLTAVSKLSRVRVDGSKNKVATTFPSSILWFGWRSKYSAFRKRSVISPSLRSEMDTSDLVLISAFGIDCMEQLR